MAPRVTVAQLRKEARSRLKECSNGKTISRMNRTELLQFLGCVGMELDAAATYQVQQDQRDADRAVAVPQGVFPREPRGYYAKSKKPRRVAVDDEGYDVNKSDVCQYFRWQVVPFLCAYTFVHDFDVVRVCNSCGCNR